MLSIKIAGSLQVELQLSRKVTAKRLLTNHCHETIAVYILKMITLSNSDDYNSSCMLRGPFGWPAESHHKATDEMGIPDTREFYILLIPTTRAIAFINSVLLMLQNYRLHMHVGKDNNCDHNQTSCVYLWYLNNWVVFSLFKSRLLEIHNMRWGDDINTKYFIWRLT